MDWADALEIHVRNRRPSGRHRITSFACQIAAIDDAFLPCSYRSSDRLGRLGAGHDWRRAMPVASLSMYLQGAAIQLRFRVPRPVSEVTTRHSPHFCCSNVCRRRKRAKRRQILFRRVVHVRAGLPRAMTSSMPARRQSVNSSGLVTAARSTFMPMQQHPLCVTSVIIIPQPGIGANG